MGKGVGGWRWWRVLGCYGGGVKIVGLGVGVGDWVLELEAGGRGCSDVWKAG